MSRVFLARYRSRCGLCEKPIEPGDDVCYVDDEPCHAACAEDAGEDVDGVLS